MKEQNPDIPFIVRRKSSKICLGIGTNEQIDTLILEPRGILVEYAGSFKYISKREVVNAVRVVRDRLKLYPATLREIEFNAAVGDGVLYEIGIAIEAMAAETRTLKKSSKPDNGHCADCCEETAKQQEIYFPSPAVCNFMSF